jgi:hypothetical protein
VNFDRLSRVGIVFAKRTVEHVQHEQFISQHGESAREELGPCDETGVDGSASLGVMFANRPAEVPDEEDVARQSEFTGVSQPGDEVGVNQCSTSLVVFAHSAGEFLGDIELGASALWHD